MGWLRAHRRVGAAVALLAMSLQFAALFGHVHLRVGAGPAAVKSQILTATDGGATADHATLPGQDGDAVCAICLVGHLAGSAVAVFAPALFVPAAHQQRAPPVRAAPAGPDLRHSFWSRGPPAV